MGNWGFAMVRASIIYVSDLKNKTLGNLSFLENIKTLGTLSMHAFAMFAAFNMWCVNKRVMLYLVLDVSHVTFPIIVLFYSVVYLASNFLEDMYLASNVSWIASDNRTDITLLMHEK